MSESTQPKKPSINQRKRARSMCVQALYKQLIAGGSAFDVEAEFITDHDMSKIDRDYFADLFHGVNTHKEQLDSDFSMYLDRAIEELTPIELVVLRQGAYELLHRLDVPYKVVINESVELAKSFGATDAHKYVNGILDKLAQKVRKMEMGR